MINNFFIKILTSAIGVKLAAVINVTTQMVHTTVIVIQDIYWQMTPIIALVSSCNNDPYIYYSGLS